MAGSHLLERISASVLTLLQLLCCSEHKMITHHSWLCRWYSRDKLMLVYCRAHSCVAYFSKLSRQRTGVHESANPTCVCPALCPRVLLCGQFSLHQWPPCILPYSAGNVVSSCQRSSVVGFPFCLIVYWYFRLTIVYGFVLTFFIHVLPYLGYGPVWSTVDNYLDDCGEYWWTNLLYINNFYPSFNNHCITGTWYLSVDMQLYAISPVLLTPYSCTGHLASPS